MKFRPIAISLSPNTEIDDLFLAFKSLLNLVVWKKGKYSFLLETWFRKYFNTEKVFLFNSGRSALFSVLKGMNLGKGDEVIVQGFTCTAVPDPILWCGAKPIFVDIDASLNIDNEKLEKSITKKTKAIIVQHTFGIPADIKKIKEITQKYNIILIEDCAHSLGAKIQGQKLGSFGDFAIFSFGRDKVVSSVFGGALLLNLNKANKNKISIAEKKIISDYNKLEYPSNHWILQQLLHPILFSLILPIYNLELGKVLLWIFQKLKILGKPVLREELSGRRPRVFPAKLPDVLARIALNQLSKLDKFNSRRRAIAAKYFLKLKENSKIKLPEESEGAIYLRFNILVDRRDEILKRFSAERILLGVWYSNVIDPKGVDYAKIGYTRGSLPISEKTAGLSLNLPTYPTLSDREVEKIISILEKI